MIAHSIVAFVYVVIVAAPPPQDRARKFQCAFPGDCVRHNYSSRPAKCVSRSAYRERLRNASTPAERAEIYRATFIGRIDKRIMRDYEVTEAQEKVVRRVLEDAYAAHRTVMGETFTEMRDLRRQMRDRLGEHLEYNRSLKRGENVEPMPSLRDDPVYNRFRDRFYEVEKKFPFDWVAVADRIEKLLPAEQAVRGRNRLIETLPHRFAPREWEDAATDAGAGGASRRVVHPWESYVRRFVSKHGVTSSQEWAAASVLKEMMERAEAARRSTFKSLIGGRNIPGDRLQKSMENLETGNDILFEELKMRLHALLTNVQRDVKDSPAAAGKP